MNKEMFWQQRKNGHALIAATTLVPFGIASSARVATIKYNERTQEYMVSFSWSITSINEETVRAVADKLRELNNEAEK